MSTISFSAAERELITAKLLAYFETELDHEIGRFDAEFLLDFLTKEIGPYYYNRGLYDAQAALMKRIDDVKEAVFSLEQPTEFQR
ncbi:MAG: DUF2164 domain-containing protein [Candidatus Kapabacteria bacterium]|nr:DUF2164 domain-containing protein [Candidatus Kapabacteria bacterium]